MEIKQLELKDLTPYANNHRKKQAIDKVASSIKEFGWQQPIVVDQDMVIVVGHTRYQAAQKLGLDKVPVQIATGLTDAQIKAYRLLDNRANQDALWDDDMLKIEVQDIDKMDIDLALTGFDEKELDKLLFVEQDGLTDEDAVPEDVEPRVKLGELWQLGDHRLLCGDATNEADVAKLMDNQKADMVFTDPPYNVDYSGRGKNNLGKIENDNMSNDKFNLFLNDCFELTDKHLKPLSSLYICHPDSKTNQKIAFEVNFGKYFAKSSTLIWEKPSAGMGWQDYRSQHEPILYGWKKGKGKHKFYGDRTKTTIWKIKRDGQSTYKHPTQKPVALIKEALLNSSKEEDIIYEPFCGSGSTLIGSETCNRKCFCLELDAKFCDVIIKRWEDFTGQTAKLLERGTDTNSFKEEEKWQDQKNTKLTQTKSLN